MAGFRRSLMGFNRDDVLNYISASDKKTKLQIDSLNNEIKELKNELLESKKTIEKYKSKEDEIERISKGIGTLYMMAKSNAEAMLSAAKSSMETSKAEVQKNLNLLEDTKQNIFDVKEKINSLNNDFQSESEKIALSLESAKSNIEENNNKADNAKNVLTNAINEIK